MAMKRLAPGMAVVVVATLARGMYTVHNGTAHAASGPIRIGADSDFTTCGCVSGGNGSPTNRTSSGRSI